MQVEESPRRILHIVSAMSRGGAETLIMNIYRHLDRSRLQFDFIVHSSAKGDFDDEIILLGGKIFKIGSLGESGLIQYIKNLTNIMSSNHYIAIHSHTDFQSGLPALAAKICGIEKRICHSHSTNWPRKKNPKNQLLLMLLRKLIQIFATDYCSCSKEAAQFLFGKKLIAQNKVKLLKNGIDITPFLESNNERETVLKELGLEKDVKIIGHVGTFSESKNHVFIIKVLKNLLETEQNYVVLLVGDGPLRNQIEKEAETIGVSSNIYFLGVRDDIPKLMKAFDVFLFPSLFEGFGIVTLEAQCAGTPCVVSNNVPKSTDMGLNLMTYASLTDGLNQWALEIKRSAALNKPKPEEVKPHFLNKGFSIQENVPEWVSLYSDSLKFKINHKIDSIIGSK
jgi:glycosyltransferase EpsF